MDTATWCAALDNPFVWAFLSAVGWAMGMLTVGSPSVGRYMAYGMAGSAMAQIPRVILPLWFVTQTRFDAALWLVIPIGGVLILVALWFGNPGLGTAIYTRPTTAEPLVISGRYAIVRHPILFANILWPLGWSLIWRSCIGVALVAFWFLLVYLMSFIEEDRLVETYGEPYREYRRSVPRLIPFVHFL
jgi:protein-S-isoprenylcysteine O-methyltransferase Ste14